MTFIPLSHRFTGHFFKAFDHTQLTPCAPDHPDRIAVISRRKRKNGVFYYSTPLPNQPPFPAGCLTIALSANVLTTCLQTRPFYTTKDVAVFIPKCDMSVAEKLFYCTCIAHHRDRYSFGRQATRSLLSLLVPAHIPSDFLTVYQALSVPSFSSQPVHEMSYTLTQTHWQAFSIAALFHNEKHSDRVTMPLFVVGKQGNVIDVLYRRRPAYSTHYVHYLQPRFTVNIYVSLFICTLLRQAQCRFNDARKCNWRRLRNTRIDLPTDTTGQPDVHFMTQYIQSLPYSRLLKKFEHHEVTDGNR